MQLLFNELVLALDALEDRLVLVRIRWKKRNGEA
jgi:hypothetical protein